MDTATADTSLPDEIRIYRETVEPLYRYVSRRCGGRRELAEDVTQETYLRAVRQWRSGSRPENHLAWLQTVARNLLISHHRRHRPEGMDPAVVDRLLGAGAGGGEPEAIDAAPAVYWGLAQLDEKTARLLEAFHIDGKPINRIARETGLSERAVEGRLHRARRALRKHLAPIVQGRKGEA